MSRFKPVEYGRLQSDTLRRNAITQEALCVRSGMNDNATYQ
jgi:hypothetical protein